MSFNDIKIPFIFVEIFGSFLFLSAREGFIEVCALIFSLAIYLKIANLVFINCLIAYKTFYFPH